MTPTPQATPAPPWGQPANVLAPAAAEKKPPGPWQEYLRVETDKFLLMGLLVFFVLRHFPAEWVTMVIGGLIGIMQSRRYSRAEDSRPGPAAK